MVGREPKLLLKREVRSRQSGKHLVVKTKTRRRVCGTGGVSAAGEALGAVCAGTTVPAPGADGGEVAVGHGGIPTGRFAPMG